MDGLTWVLGLVARIFNLFSFQVFGIPIYVFIVGIFVFTLVAKFIAGRK